MVDLVNREAFLAARRTGIGGSDAAALLGISPYRNQTPYLLYLDKLGLLPNEAAQDNEEMAWGRRLEDLVADHYAELTKRALVKTKGMIRSPERPHLIANIDRKILPCEGHETPGVYEGKTETSFNRAKWKDGVPLHYEVQVQHYLYVHERDWAAVACLIGGSHFVHFEVPRNDTFIAAYVRKADEFWERVQNREPPLPTGETLERKAIEALAEPLVRRKSKSLTGRTWLLLDAYEEAKAELASAKRILDAYESLVRVEMGDAEWGVFPDGSGFHQVVVELPERVWPKATQRRLYKVKKVRS